MSLALSITTQECTETNLQTLSFININGTMITEHGDSSILKHNIYYSNG